MKLLVLPILLVLLTKGIVNTSADIADAYENMVNALSNKNCLELFGYIKTQKFRTLIFRTF